jgi:hypothetical protein
MFDGLLAGLLVAWVLTLFQFDEIFTTSAKELFNIEITIASYYMIFAAVGFLGGLTKIILNSVGAQ